MRDDAMEDDAALVAEARRGDGRAYRMLYERHRPVVSRLAQAFGGMDADEVADVVQESFARAFSGIDSLRDPTQFRPWLLTIARNRCLSYRHARKTEQRAQGELARLPADVEPLPLPAHLAREQERQIVRELIEAMPEGPEKRTAVLFYLDGDLSVREIAERQGENKSAVAMRLERFRARFKLRLLARLEPAEQDAAIPLPAKKVSP